MKRLRDMEGGTPLQREAQRLIDSVEPLADSPERMARVRRRLDEPRGLMVAIRRLPALAIAALIALFGASAFAAVRVLVEVQQARVQSSSRPTQLHGEKPRSQAAPSVSAVEEAPEEQEEQGQQLEQLAPTGDRMQPRARAKPRVAAPAPAHEHEAHDSELVHRAVKALRVDRNPSLAARLLEQDRIRNPSGPLAEEALSLRIEAALKLRDPRARTFAEQYIARYPKGRYLRIAQRARGEGSAR
jgi:hypothetical protein